MLPPDAPRHMRHCPSSLDMNVLFHLLAEAQRPDGMSRIEFASFASLAPVRLKGAEQGTCAPRIELSVLDAPVDPLATLVPGPPAHTPDHATTCSRCSARWQPYRDHAGLCLVQACAGQGLLRMASLTATAACCRPKPGSVDPYAFVEHGVYDAGDLAELAADPAEPIDLDRYLDRIAQTH